MLLDHGADADGVRPVNFDLIAPGPSTTKLVDKISLIMRHGGNADHWASSLFDAIAARDQLARASDRLLRENARIPETASFIPVRTAWVDDLLKNPARTPDGDADRLLREAISLRDSRPARRDGPASIMVGNSARSELPILPPAQGSAVPHRTRDEFLTYTAAELQKRLPGFTVTPDLGQASLLIMTPSGTKAGHVSPQMEFATCRESESFCRESLNLWIDAAVEFEQNRLIAPAIADVQVLVNSRTSLEAELAPRDPRAPRVLMRRCLGELVCALAADNGWMLRYVDAQDLKSMNLSEDRAYELALDNSRRLLRPASRLKVPTEEHPIQFADLASDQSSRVLFTADWASLAASVHGDLIMAVPASGLVVYGLGGNQDAVRRLRQFAEDSMPGALRPLSTTVFRWTGKGWESAARIAVSAAFQFLDALTRLPQTRSGIRDTCLECREWPLFHTKPPRHLRPWSGARRAPGIQTPFSLAFGPFSARC